MNVLNLTNPAFGLGQTFSRYLNPIMNSPKRIGLKKMLNVLHAEMERRTARIRLNSKPFVLHIEPTNICNLKCPNCYTGSGRNPLPKGLLLLSDYKNIVDQLKRYLVLARLDGVGESFLNPDIFSMADYTSKNNIISAISTNFVSLKTGQIRNIIDTGLDYLIVSLDGATKDTYESIRFGARFEEVLSNIREIVRLKKLCRSRTPYIEAQFVVFESNKHEMGMVKKLSEELGVDRLLIKEARKSVIIKARDKEGGAKPCYWLWYVLNSTWTGDLKACCTSGLVSEFSFGNIARDPVLSVWNNDSYVNLRKLFSADDKGARDSLGGCKCLDCYKLKR